MALAVIEPFAEHAIGDRITDSAEVAAILASDAHVFVVRVADEPAPVAAPEPAKES